MWEPQKLNSHRACQSRIWTVMMINTIEDQSLRIRKTHLKKVKQFGHEWSAWYLVCSCKIWWEDVKMMMKVFLNIVTRRWFSLLNIANIAMRSFNEMRWEVSKIVNCVFHYSILWAALHVTEWPIEDNLLQIFANCWHLFVL